MTTVVAQRSPAAATPQGYQGATASAQPTEHAAGPGGVLMTDPTPGAEGEATELEAIAEPPREADGATDGGNNPSAEDATTTPEVSPPKGERNLDISNSSARASVSRSRSAALAAMQYSIHSAPVVLCCSPWFNLPSLEGSEKL